VSLSSKLAAWAAGVGFDDLPRDVVQATKLRILDIIGLALAGAETDFGRATRTAAVALSPEGPCRLLGTGDRAGPAAAAFANAACAQALEFDDTHNESIVHMSGPSVATALALSEVVPMSGRDLVAAVAVGSEVSCRVGSVSPGQFHRLGFHPTGLFAVFGVSYLTCRVLGLDAGTMTRAAGIAGSFSSGLLECWVDGTQSKYIHSGWATHGGMTAAFLARAGMSGPATIFEGRFGLFASHVQDPAVPRNLSRIVDRLGEHWESRNASFKPFPAAHVLHPYIDALLRLRDRHAIEPSDVERIDCPVAAFIVPIVCEPAGEKLSPASDSHGRVSLQYTLAEALYHGHLGKTAYRADSLTNPEILALARRVRYAVDPGFPGPGRFKGVVRVTLKDGRTWQEVEEHTRGSVENPMSYEELRAKFDDNAAAFLSARERDQLVEEIRQAERLPDARVLVDLSIGK
jgi:2-methylcitrate dehydratase PrpD